MSRSAPWLAPTLALVGSCGIAAAWILLAAALDRQCSWMAVFAALDAALLLRFGRIRGGWRRAAWGVAATLVTIVLANWGIAATQLGQAMGLLPWESMRRMGMEHAWLLTRLANDAIDVAWCGAALVVAAVTSR